MKLPTKMKLVAKGKSAAPSSVLGSRGFCRVPQARQVVSGGAANQEIWLTDEQSRRGVNVASALSSKPSEENPAKNPADFKIALDLHITDA